MGERQADARGGRGDLLRSLAPRLDAAAARMSS